MLKNATKNCKRNLKKMPKILMTLSLQMRVSIFFRLRASNIYDRGHLILSGTAFKKYFLLCEHRVCIASCHGIFKWKLLSKTTSVKGRKQKWTIILTQIPFCYHCLVCIKMVPRQFFIEEMLLKIYHQAYFINIIWKIYVEFLGNPLLLKRIWNDVID